MSIEINPQRLRGGPWDDGYALDWHTLSSTFIGNNQFGHPMFDTKRPPVGQLLYRLKYQRDWTAVDPLAATAENFIRNTWGGEIDAIVPVPPSNVRPIQPVAVVADALAARLGVPVCTDCIMKVKKTPQLKDIKEYDKRVEVLTGAFAVASEQTREKDLLLFDDLFRSGATVRAIVELLKERAARKLFSFSR